MTKTRKFPRITFSALTELMLSEEDTTVQAYPFSAGCGGMGIYALRPIPVGQEISTRVYLSMENGRKTVDTMSGIVKWCDLFGSLYKMGVEFKDMNPSEHTPFISYVKGLARTR